MNKLFSYELRRLLLNKYFFGLLAIALLFGYLLLENPVLQGIENTAPFSERSMGWYISRQAVLLCLGELLLGARYYSAREMHAQTLIGSTAINPRALALVRALAVLVVCLILGAAVCILPAVMYSVLFGTFPLWNLLCPALEILPAALLLTLAAGAALGRLRLLTR